MIDCNAVRVREKSFIKIRKIYYANFTKNKDFLFVFFSPSPYAHALSFFHPFATILMNGFKAEIYDEVVLRRTMYKRKSKREGERERGEGNKLKSNSAIEYFYFEFAPLSFVWIKDAEELLNRNKRWIKALHYS